MNFIPVNNSILEACIKALEYNSNFVDFIIYQMLMECNIDKSGVYVKLNQNGNFYTGHVTSIYMQTTDLSNCPKLKSVTIKFPISTKVFFPTTTIESLILDYNDNESKLQDFYGNKNLKELSIKSESKNRTGL